MRQYSTASAMLALYALASIGAVAVACDDRRPTAGSPAMVVPSSPTEELLQRLESLVEPVSQRVGSCNQELADAKAKSRRIASELGDAESELTKTLRGLLFLKNALLSDSCQVCIGGQIYSRETIGKVLEFKITEYRGQAAITKKLIDELAAQESVVRDVAAKVAMWVEKEAELLAQVDQLENVQADIVDSRRAATEAVDIESVNELVTSVEEMLEPVAEANSNAELLAEVDSILEGTR